MPSMPRVCRHDVLSLLVSGIVKWIWVYVTLKEKIHRTEHRIVVNVQCQWWKRKVEKVTIFERRQTQIMNWILTLPNFCRNKNAGGGVRTHDLQISVRSGRKREGCSTIELSRPLYGSHCPPGAWSGHYFINSNQLQADLKRVHPSE